MAASDQEISSWILEFLLRQPIPNDLLHLIHLALPLPTTPPPRVLKTLLLRRLAGDLASAIPYQTLETLELIEQLDRDHNLVPSPSAALQRAYSAVVVDLTARFLKEEDGDLGDFLDAVNRVWNCRVGDLEGSEARGLVSGRLREERRVMEEAVVSGVVRRMLRKRETTEEAAEAVRDYLKEAAEKELGPTILEVGAAAVLGGDEERCDVGRDELRMRVGGTDALNEGGCSTSGFSHFPVPEAIQEKNQLKPRDEEDHNMVEEPILDTVTVADGVPLTAETVEDSDPDRMEEDQSLMDEGQVPSVDNGTEVIHTKDVSSVTDHNRVQGTVVQPSIADQNPTELKHEEENQNALDGNVKVSFVDKGAEVTHTRDISSVTDHNRVHDTVMQPSISDQNRTELEHGVENQNALDGNVKVSIVYKGKVAVMAECTTNVAVDTEGTNVAVNTEVTSTLSGKKRDIHAVRAPSIMDRNPTAQTYTWHGDLFESSSEKSPNPSEKIRVLRPKRRVIPVTKIPWNKEFAGRRKKKWWSVDEEDTLRKAVDKYGAGNWVLIKNSYPATFEDRTPIDLKDKWRNMTR